MADLERKKAKCSVSQSLLRTKNLTDSDSLRSYFNQGPTNVAISKRGVEMLDICYTEHALSCCQVLQIYHPIDSISVRRRQDRKFVPIVLRQ